MLEVPGDTGSKSFVYSFSGSKEQSDHLVAPVSVCVLFCGSSLTMFSFFETILVFLTRTKNLKT